MYEFDAIASTTARSQGERSDAVGGSVRVVLVGAGTVGERHAEAVRAAGDVVTAIVDPGVTCVHESGAPTFDSIEAWVASGTEADVAIVASPTVEHADQTTTLTAHGLPVLVEKPHRMPGQLAPALLDAPAPVAVGMTTRFGSGLLATHRALRSGELGTPLLVEDRIVFDVSGGRLPSWYLDPSQSGGGVLATNGIHALDRVAWLLGESLTVLDARLQASRVAAPVEEIVVLRLRAPAGTDVAIVLAWTQHPVEPGPLRVLGTRGMCEAWPDGRFAVETVGRSGRRLGPEPVGRPFDRQWQEFRRFVRGRRSRCPTVADLERSLALIETIYATTEVTAP